jgi:hypothetical protein
MPLTRYSFCGTIRLPQIQAKVNKMRSPGWLALFLITTVVLLGPAVSRSETIIVTGQTVAVGNSGCTPSPCTETIDFSFELSPYQAPFYENPGGIVPNFLLASFTSTGPSGYGGGYLGLLQQEGPNYDYGYFYLGGTSDEVDFGFTIAAVAGGYEFTTGYAHFYSCETAVCEADFTPNDEPCLNLFCNTPQFAPTQLSIVYETPEPSIANLLACEMLTLLMLISVVTANKTRSKLQSEQTLKVAA